MIPLTHLPELPRAVRKALSFKLRREEDDSEEEEEEEEKEE